MTVDTHADSDLVPMDEPGQWLVRGGVRSPVLAVVWSLRDALTRAYEEEMKAVRSVLVIVKAPVDEIAIRPAQMFRLWRQLGLSVG
jgi:hypothetical protein